MKKILALILISALCITSLVSCATLSAIGVALFMFDYEGDTYYLGANWDCNTEAFIAEYQPLYLEEIERLRNKYHLDMETTISAEHVKRSEDSLWKYRLEVYIYDERCSIRLLFTDIEYKNETQGYYKANLYYYGSENGFGDYEDFKPMVEFLNDITNYTAYDARADQNHFERLYYEAVQNEGKHSSWEIHFDNTIGNVRYLVQLANENVGGYHYMALKDESIKKNCYHFNFEGLLKALP